MAMPFSMLRACVVGIALAAAGCESPPVRDTEVLVLKGGELPPGPGLPPPGTTWRLDEQALLALSPAPYVAPPSPPIPAPPPPAVAVPVVPYPAPYPYGWGVPYYGPVFGFSFGYSESRHSHRRRRH